MRKAKSYILLKGGNMTAINNRLSSDDEKILMSFKGSTLRSFEGYFLFDEPDLYTDVNKEKLL